MTIYERPADVRFTWDRRATHRRLETETTRRIIAAHFPPPPADVLDIGGGNGFWSFDLAGRGYRVRLCDSSPALITDGRQRDPEHRVDMTLADARDLPYPSRSADAALFFGPMYGLRSAADRAAALAEARRVLRPGGVLLVEALPRIAPLRELVTRAPAVVADADWRSFLRTGVTDDPAFPEFYRHNAYLDPADVAAELTAAGLETQHCYGVDGPDPMRQDVFNRMSSDLLLLWSELSFELGRDMAAWAACAHTIHVAVAR